MTTTATQAALPSPNSKEQVAMRDRVVRIVTQIRKLQRELKLIKGQHGDKEAWPWWHCLRCGYDWQSDSPALVPRCCSRCHSRAWNRSPGERKAATRKWKPREPLDPPNPNWKPTRGRMRKPRMPRPATPPAAAPTTTIAPPATLITTPTTPILSVPVDPSRMTLPPLPRMADVLSMSRAKFIETYVTPARPSPQVDIRHRQREAPQPESLRKTAEPDLLDLYRSAMTHDPYMRSREAPQPESQIRDLPPLPPPAASPPAPPAHANLEHALEVAAEFTRALETSARADRGLPPGPHPDLDEDIARYERRERGDE